MNIVNTDFDKDEFRAALEMMKREMSNYIEYQKLIAKIQREKYNACIEEGFKPEEALLLCQKVI